MPDATSRPVLGRPPVDADDEQLDEWVDALLDALLGTEGETEPNYRADSE